MKLSDHIFTNVHVLVVGDVMLDRYWFGQVDRVSPEAPVPVLAVQHEQVRMGGAANVAHNIRALGGQCSLLSVVGEDASGEKLQQILTDIGVTSKLRKDDSFTTIEKLRMMAQNQQLLRADFEQSPSEEVLEQCLDDYQQALVQADVVVLSDYGKGGLKHVASMIELANDQSVPVLVDPKGNDYSAYTGASLITPNMKEFEAVVGVVDSETEFTARANTLRESLGLEKLLVTRSDKGMTLIDNQAQRIDCPASALEVYDVSGAGDTVIALMALSWVSEMNDQQRLVLANAGAGIVVGKVGTAVVTMEELVNKLAQTSKL